MPTILARPGYAPTGIWSTDEVVPSTLKVDLSSSTYATMLRLIVPVAGGDLVDVHGWARVTNDLSYVVGVGYHLWAYDVDDGLGSKGTWTRISPYKGDNVDTKRHHLPIDVSCAYQVPADWPDGHRMTVVLRADAHSTAWRDGDTLTVDRLYGSLVVRRWSPIAAGELAALTERLAGAEARLAAAEARLAALETPPPTC